MTRFVDEMSKGTMLCFREIIEGTGAALQGEGERKWGAVRGEWLRLVEEGFAGAVPLRATADRRILAAGAFGEKCSTLRPTEVVHHIAGLSDRRPAGSAATPSPLWASLTASADAERQPFYHVPRRPRRQQDMAPHSVPRTAIHQLDGGAPFHLYPFVTAGGQAPGPGVSRPHGANSPEHTLTPSFIAASKGSAAQAAHPHGPNSPEDTHPPSLAPLTGSAAQVDGPNSPENIQTPSSGSAAQAAALGDVWTEPSRRQHPAAGHCWQKSVQRDGLAVDGGYDLFSGADVDSASSDSGEHLAALLGDDGDKGGGRSRRPFPKVLGEPVRIVGIEGESQSADEALRQNLLSRVRRDYRWRLFGLGRGVAVQCWNVRTGNVSSRSSGRIETPGEVAKGFQVSLAAGFLERAADDGRCHVLAVDSCNIFVPRHFLTKHREEHWIP